MKNPATNPEIAKAAGKTVRTIEGYVQRGMPRTSVKAALAWIAKEINQDIGRASISERKAGKTRGNSPGDLEVEELQAKIRKLLAEAETKELKNAQVRGELVDRSEIVREFAEFLACTRPILDAIPDDIATETPHDLRARHRQIAKNAVDRALKKLSQWQPGTSLDDTASGVEGDRAETVDTSDQVGA